MKDALKRISTRLPLDTILEVFGLIAIAYGVAMIFIPAGVITAGAGLCFIGYALSPTPEPTIHERVGEAE